MSPHVFAVGARPSPLAANHSFRTAPAVVRAVHPNPFADAQPACDLPVVSLEEWIERHGVALPDHPLVFRPSPLSTMRAFSSFPDADAFLASPHAEAAVHTEPGYAQAGGHLAYTSVRSAVGRNWPSVRALAAAWDVEPYHGQYVSEFNCNSAYAPTGLDDPTPLSVCDPPFALTPKTIETRAPQAVPAARARRAVAA